MIEKEIVEKIPDISKDVKSIYPVTLEKVGMQNIELPILIESNNRLINIPAAVDVFVNLKKPQAKGIHMSRLFLKVQNLLTDVPLSDESLIKLLIEVIDSHKDLSDESFIKLDFDYFLERDALVSKAKGWKSYPISIEYKIKKGKVIREFSTSLTYSSTCPCSAALARQDVQNNFIKEHQNKTKFFKEEVFDWLGKESSISATPHAQRSEAFIKVKSPQKNLSFVELINLGEEVLKTATQSAVKREDEQEFARLNGRNLMFCEDAAKKLKMVLNKSNFCEDFYIKVCHFESLHPHDATAVSVKGIPNGYTA